MFSRIINLFESGDQVFIYKPYQMVVLTILGGIGFLCLLIGTLRTDQTVTN